MVALDFEAALGKVYFPANVELRLGLQYTGQLHPSAGLYRSQAFASGGGQSVLLVTQLESQGARWLFPCYDHPSVKVWAPILPDA